MLNYADMSSVESMADVEHHFRVFAGPGAGKTRWLISHLGRVLKESKRLEKTKKIACITHTKVAAEEIMQRLNYEHSRLDISTIHSFLYRNIIKPFAFLIKKDMQGNDLFNIDELSGHIEHIPHADRIRSWKGEIELLNNKKYDYFNFAQNKTKLFEKLRSLDYELINDNVELVFRKPYIDIAIPKKNNELFLYKKKYWSKGILHHEDVLYFSYYLLTNYPRVKEFIRNKFPFIFIDEFQDTSKLQTQIIKIIAEQETIVGVIGDLAQSIYLFSGAKRKDFEDFTLVDSITNYKMETNYRSTKNIIDFLNNLRDDIQQKECEITSEGYPVTILIGTYEKAIRWFATNNLLMPTILARKNDKVNMIRHGLKANPLTNDLIEQMFQVDSDKSRPYFIYCSLNALDYYKKGNIKDAISQILKNLNKDKDGKKVELPSLVQRRLAIDILQDLNNEISLEKTIMTYFTKIQARLLKEYNIKIGAKYGVGQAKDFASSHELKELMPFIKTDTRITDRIRTIHSAKGTEFDSVLLVLDDEKEFNKWIVDSKNQIKNDKDDSSRIYYVALSRAKSFLFINVPSFLDVSDCEFIRNLKIINLN